MLRNQHETLERTRAPEDSSSYMRLLLNPQHIGVTKTKPCSARQKKAARREPAPFGPRGNSSLTAPVEAPTSRQVSTQLRLSLVGFSQWRSLASRRRSRSMRSSISMTGRAWRRAPVTVTPASRVNFSTSPRRDEAERPADRRLSEARGQTQTADAHRTHG